MKIVLATANKGKIAEFEKLLPNENVVAFSDILGSIDIVEDKSSFQGNAVKKAQTIYDELCKAGINDAVVISDDSGISLPVLNNAPGIFSARYAGDNATDKMNNEKLISKLKALNLTKTEAFYTACIAIIYKNQVYTVHGFMHGFAIDKEMGTNGFGYDPLFIPLGFDKTLGELDYEVKKDFSHRSKALNLAKKVLDIILN